MNILKQLVPTKHHFSGLTKHCRALRSSYLHSSTDASVEVHSPEQEVVIALGYSYLHSSTDASVEVHSPEQELLEECSSTADCGAGLLCGSCPTRFDEGRCIRSNFTNQFKLLNNSLPFNKYAYLTTHNSFAIDGEPSHTGIPRLALQNQEDSITQQLNDGV